MTWKEFKDKVEAAGARDIDEIEYIDFSNDFNNLVFEADPDAQPGDPRWFHIY